MVELAVVMVVVGLLSGVSILSLSGLTGSQRNVAATRVRNALIFAADWAAGSNLDTWVEFDTGSDLVSVHVEDAANPGKAGRLPMPDPLTRSAMTVQLGSDASGLDSVDFGGTSEVQFDPQGTPRDADGAALSSDGTVVLTGGLTVRVTKTTGRVSIDP